MKFTLSIDCDNAAFGDTALEREVEIARILQELVEGGRMAWKGGHLFDLNGNRVGRYQFEP